MKCRKSNRCLKNKYGGRPSIGVCNACLGIKTNPENQACAYAEDTGRLHHGCKSCGAQKKIRCNNDKVKHKFVSSGYCLTCSEFTMTG